MLKMWKTVGLALFLLALVSSTPILAEDGACTQIMIDKMSPEVSDELARSTLLPLGQVSAKSEAAPDGRIVKTSTQHYLVVEGLHPSLQADPLLHEYLQNDRRISRLASVGSSEDLNKLVLGDPLLQTLLDGVQVRAVGVSCKGSCTGSSCGVSGCDPFGTDCSMCSCTGSCSTECTCEKTSN